MLWITWDLLFPERGSCKGISLLMFVLASLSFLVCCGCSSPIYLLLFNFWRSIRLLIEAKNGFVDFIGGFNCGLVFMG